MERLLVLRHAEAVGQARTDLERTLTATGERQAEEVAAWIAANAPPDLVLASPAERTRQTARAVVAATGASVRIEGSMYGAGALELLALAQSLHAVPSLLLVGHNPACEDLCRHLAAGRWDGAPVHPAGLAVFDVDGDLPAGAMLRHRLVGGGPGALERQGGRRGLGST